MQTALKSEPVAPYIGGKFRLAKTIVPIIDSIEHKLYAEPFIGMGGIFFRRKLKPKSEVMNDYNREVANLFRILQRHFVAFIDMLKFQLTTRAEFERLLKVNPETLTDLESAARFLYLQRTTFSGNILSRSFGVSTERPARFDVTKLTAILEDVHTRLSSVVIENLHYEEFIPRYDRDYTLFYLDPPYWNCEDYYGKGLFSKNDFQNLADLLASLKGNFIMSINDAPEIRDLFNRFSIMNVQTLYTASKTNTKKVSELLISNVKLTT